MGPKEGILVGISAGAAIKAAIDLAVELGAGKRVLALVRITVNVIFRQLFTNFQNKKHAKNEHFS